MRYMKLFDFFRPKEKNETVTLEQLKASSYEMKYSRECRFIWKSYVPEKGQCSVLQGEVLREIEKLRYEAQNNGNANWDEGFDRFCGFIESTLCSMEIYSETEKEKFRIILKYFSECGRYALRMYDGKISSDEFDIDMIAWVDDNLYDILADAVGYWQSNSPDPVPYEPVNDIHR